MRLTRCRGDRITGNSQLPGNSQGITGNYLSMISITRQPRSHSPGGLGIVFEHASDLILPSCLTLFKACVCNLSLKI